MAKFEGDAGPDPYNLRKVHINMRKMWEDMEHNLFEAINKAKKEKNETEEEKGKKEKRNESCASDDTAMRSSSLDDVCAQQIPGDVSSVFSHFGLAGSDQLFASSPPLAAGITPKNAHRNWGSTASEQLESTQDQDTLQNEWVVSSRTDRGVAGLRKGEGTKHPVKEESSPLSDSRRRIDKESVVLSKTGCEVLEDASAGEERWGRDTGAASQGWDCGDMDEMMPSDSASVVRDSEVRALKTALQDMQRRTQPLTAGARSGKSKWEQAVLQRGTPSSSKPSSAVNSRGISRRPSVLTSSTF